MNKPFLFFSASMVALTVLLTGCKKETKQNDGPQIVFEKQDYYPLEVALITVKNTTVRIWIRQFKAMKNDDSFDLFLSVSYMNCSKINAVGQIKHSQPPKQLAIDLTLQTPIQFEF